MMRVSFGKFARGGAARMALATALATGLVAGGVTLGATAATAKEKEAAKAGSFSKEFITAAGPLQKVLNDATAAKAKGVSEADLKTQLAGAPEQLAAAEAAIKNPTDRMTAGQFAVNLGGMLGDVGMRERGIKNMLDSGLVPADKVTEYQFYLGNFAYTQKDWPVAAEALTKVVQANYSEDTAAELLADVYVQQGKPAEGLQALKLAVDTRKAAGGTVPADWFKRANLIAYKAKLGPQAIEWSTMMVENDPSPINWLGAGQLTREFGTFTNQESLDLGRLMMRSGAFQSDPKYLEREYVEYIEAADPRRLPGEVLKVAEAGVAAGVLRANDQFVTDALSQAKGRIAADKASLPGLERDARAGADGKGALATADAYLSYGEAAKAEDLYKLAIQKGSIDKDRALTRLGIAQCDEGKYDEAKATFAQITGAARAPLAKLWTVYATTKAAK